MEGEKRKKISETRASGGKSSNAHCKRREKTPKSPAGQRGGEEGSTKKGGEKKKKRSGATPGFLPVIFGGVRNVRKIVREKTDGIREESPS